MALELLKFEVPWNCISDCYFMSVHLIAKQDSGSHSAGEAEALESVVLGLCWRGYLVAWLVFVWVLFCFAVIICLRRQPKRKKKCLGLCFKDLSSQLIGSMVSRFMAER